jgi:metal iron transporter
MQLLTDLHQVIIVLASFIALLVRVKPDWSLAMDGFVPSKTLVSTPEALYASIGIIGETSL